MRPIATSALSARTAAPVLLRDIEDLHDADLDQVMADRLAESADVLRAVVAATELSVQVAVPDALRAHSLGAVARRLAG
ncbi:hypothetical protein [Blastococcus capsensis]|uniref:hypothetical protein n=1 Tax=Blastococcus capsensis TaxID=1564163 RepID=UPI002541A3D7|nr:hypothetical protein [Blastococcus capsensis]MDK3256409.1 hypothetical protein [Blastococcus capsensis]